MDISFEQTVQRIAEATKDLEKLTAELSLQQDQSSSGCLMFSSGPQVL